MSTYSPDKWVIIKITSSVGIHYRVFASWYGGYAGSDSWKMNSGITHVTESGDCWEFHGVSKSIYRCSKYVYGTSGYSGGVLGNYMQAAADSDSIKIELLDESTDWVNFDWGSNEEAE